MAEPVTLAEARSQVNIIDAGDTTYDTFLTSLIAPARATVERISRFFWVGGAKTEVFDRWGDRHCGDFFNRRSRERFIEIYRSPITSIDGITYGPTGTETAYTGFVAQLAQLPVYIFPAVDADFPHLNRGDTIIVSYTAGALASTSEDYLMGKRAMLLLIGHWFANREGVIADLRAAVADVPWAVTELLDNIRPMSAY